MSGTFQHPGGPGPVRVEALAEARLYLGKKETARNQGPIVEQVAKPFLSTVRFEQLYPEGKLAWCAFFVCYCVLQVLIRRGLDEIGRIWRHLARGRCVDLWESISTQGWTWRKGYPLPSALTGQHVDVPGLPAAGDLVFYGHEAIEDGELKLHLHHVDFFSHLEGDEIVTVGGNSGPTADRVFECHRSPEKQEEIWSYGRLPW